MKKCPHCGAENDDFSMFCSKCWEDITKGPLRSYSSSFETPAVSVEPLPQAGVPSPASGERKTEKEAEVQKLEDVLKNVLEKSSGAPRTQEQDKPPDISGVVFEKKKTLPAGLQTAGFSLRFQAMLFDGFVLVFSVVFLSLFGFARFFPAHTLSLILSPIYFVFFISRFGQTPGKWFMGLKVVSEDGHSPVSAERAFIRWLGYYVNMLFFGLGYIWVSVDPNHQGFHDKMAKTIVIKLK